MEWNGDENEGRDNAHSLCCSECGTTPIKLPILLFSLSLSFTSSIILRCSFTIISFYLSFWFLILSSTTLPFLPIYIPYIKHNTCIFMWSMIRCKEQRMISLERKFMPSSRRAGFPFIICIKSYCSGSHDSYLQCISWGIFLKLPMRMIIFIDIKITWVNL